MIGDRNKLCTGLLKASYESIRKSSFASIWTAYGVTEAQMTCGDIVDGAHSDWTEESVRDIDLELISKKHATVRGHVYIPYGLISIEIPLH